MFASKVKLICSSGNQLRYSTCALYRAKQFCGQNYGPFLLANCQKRHLYSDEALSMSAFLKQRTQLQKQYPGEQIDEFFDAMEKNVSEDKSGGGLVFMQDLKNAIYLSSDDSNKLEVLNKMMSRYCQQKSTTRFGKFSFGPVLMRLYYHLNTPVHALEALESSYCRELFNDPSSYQIALCLFYKNQMYEEMLNLLDRIIKERLTGMNYPKNCILLGLAAILTLDNEESYKRGLALVEKSFYNKGNTPGTHRRLLALATCVSLKAGSPQVALQLIKNSPMAEFPAIRNAAILAWLEMGDLLEALSLMRRVAAAESFRRDQNIVYQHVHDAVARAVLGSRQPELKEELRRIQRGLTDGQMLSKENLFEVVLKPMKSFDKSASLESDKFNKGASKRFENERNSRRVSSLMDTMEG